MENVHYAKSITDFTIMLSFHFTSFSHKLSKIVVAETNNGLVSRPWSVEFKQDFQPPSEVADASVARGKKSPRAGGTLH